MQKKDEILSCLKSGIQIAGSRQIIFCPIYKNEIGAQEIFTDGFWFWTIEAIYYIEKYDIEIPSDFIKHIQKDNFSCPKIDENDDLFIDVLYEKVEKLV